jgi:hypothetical protein
MLASNEPSKGDLEIAMSARDDLRGTLDRAVNEMEPYISPCAERGNCIMARSREIGRLRGIPVHEPDLDSLASTFDRLSDPLDHAFDRRPVDPHPAWRRIVRAIDAMVTTSLCHDRDTRLRSESLPIAHESEASLA